MGIASSTSVLEEQTIKQVVSWLYKRQQRWGGIFFIPQQKSIDCFVLDLSYITSPYPQNPMEFAE